MQGESSMSKWTKGQSGNPGGKPKGTRHRATTMVLAMMEGSAEEVTRAILQAAKGGDTTAAKLVLERLAPPARERPICLDLPDTSTAAGIALAHRFVVEAVTAGEILPSEATALAALLDGQRKALETMELEARIAALEAREVEQ